MTIQVPDTAVKVLQALAAHDLVKAVAFIRVNLTKGLNVIIGPAGIDYDELQYQVGGGEQLLAPELNQHLGFIRATHPALLTLILSEVEKLFLEQGIFNDPRWDPDKDAVIFKGFWGEELVLGSETPVIWDTLDDVTRVISPYSGQMIQVYDLGYGFSPIYVPQFVHSLADWAVSNDKTVVAATNNPRILDGLNIRNRDKLFLVRRLKDEHKREVTASLAKTPDLPVDEPWISLGEAWVRGYLCC